MGLALYRKYRPRSLDEIVGQDHITDLLKTAIKNDRIAHAYLLTGPRGVGKTSIARILAFSINGLKYSDKGHIDIIEIDAASNTGVDNIRDLKDKVLVAPTVAKKKVYIIDEVHMLSKSAFNALLKTLEEPPTHVVFILATTNPEKLPDTIISRTQRFNFRLVPEKLIADHLKFIAKNENINAESEVFNIIAKQGNGSFRDSITLFDQISSLSSQEKITKEKVLESIGLVDYNVIKETIKLIINGDLKQIADQINILEYSGVSASILAEQLIYELQKYIIKYPKLSNLTLKLINIRKSTYPYPELLASLINTASDFKEKVSNIKAKKIEEISSDLSALNKIASYKKPTENKLNKLAKKELEDQSKTKEEIQKDPVEETVSPKSEDKKDTKLEDKKETNGSVNRNFDFQEVINIVQENDDTALYALLSKCKTKRHNETLTIYSSGIYKKKLSEATYFKKIKDIITKIDNTIEIIDIKNEKLQLKDASQQEAIDIMGGGEIIDV